MKRWAYPFTAIVGQDTLKTSLILNAVDPAIGGVLIRGPKGTGKSTAARALAALLPPIQVVAGCPYNSHPQEPASGTDAQPSEPGAPGSVVWRPTPFIELPLNATEDRLAGTLHLEKSLRAGSRQFEPGLLASANRGILYVDEVNLLDDHLVDLLLDAASSGVNIVEREGLSHTHAARFMLIGTMNPEEGELRPQLLDRFGLCVAIDSIHNPADRAKIVRQRLEFEDHPETFAALWQPEEQAVSAQIQIARSGLDQVCIPDEVFRMAGRLAHDLNVHTHRADVALVKAARAHAAFLEKHAVGLDDLRTAAQFALPHRVACSPLETSQQIQARLDDVFGRLAAQPSPAGSAGPAPGDPEPAQDADDELESMAAQMQVPGVCAAGSILLDFIKKKIKSPFSKPTNG